MIRFPLKILQFKYCVDVVLTQTQDILHLDWKVDWRSLGWNCIESLVVIVRDFLFFTFFVFLVFFMGFLNFLDLWKFVMEVLWGFRAWIQWSFDGSKSLKFLEALKLDSSRTLRLGRMIWMNILCLCKFVVKVMWGFGRLDS